MERLFTHTQPKNSTQIPPPHIRSEGAAYETGEQRLQCPWGKFPGISPRMQQHPHFEKMPHECAPRCRPFCRKDLAFSQ